MEGGIEIQISYLNTSASIWLIRTIVCFRTRKGKHKMFLKGLIILTYPLNDKGLVIHFLYPILSLRDKVITRIHETSVCILSSALIKT